MNFLQDALGLLRDPGKLIAWGGYPGLALIVFLETGALVFFLPGDSLLVIAGLFAADGKMNIFLLNCLLGPLAVLGDACSYMIGKRLGPRLFKRPKSRLFNPEHIHAAHAFYERHGGKAIIMARFVPIVRTFVPVVAGVAEMSYRRFAVFNVVGGLSWVASMTLTGYVLGERVPWVRTHTELVIVAVIAVSLLPGAYEYARARLKA